MDENHSINIIAIIHNEKNQILTIKKKLDPLKNYYLSLPGGIVNFKERIEDTLKREVYENLCLIIEPLEILGVYSDFKDNNNEILISIVFICLIIDYIAEDIDKEKTEKVEKQWVDVNNIFKYEFISNHKVIIEDYLNWRNHNCTFWSSKLR